MARLCDSLKLFEEEEPVLPLRGLMKESFANDKFEVVSLANWHFVVKCLCTHLISH